MPGIKDLTEVWKNVREIDLQPIRESAERPVQFALVGAAGSGRHTLAGQMRSDPARPTVCTQTPVTILDLEAGGSAESDELVILVIDATAPDYNREAELARSRNASGKKLIVLFNKLDAVKDARPFGRALDWEPAPVLFGSVTDRDFLVNEFAPAVMDLVPEAHIALARQFPLFRIPVAQVLISDMSKSNAVYALSTGFAEIIPLLDVPFNLADMVILTKAQALLVYKLGLAFGLSTRWQDHLAQFGSVIGGGFVWRQIARQLVGLIPIWGIVPKAAVAYAGTFVLGQAILQWYITGRHLSRKQMGELYRQAFSQGKSAVKGLLSRAPRTPFRKRLRAGSSEKTKA